MNWEFKTGDKVIVKQFHEMDSSVERWRDDWNWGFSNMMGYDSTEHYLKPTREYGEIRMYNMNDEYSDWIKVKNPLGSSDYPRYKKWYGISGNYFIKNLGSDCQIVYEMIPSSVDRDKKLKSIGI